MPRTVAGPARGPRRTRAGPRRGRPPGPRPDGPAVARTSDPRPSRRRDRTTRSTGLLPGGSMSQPGRRPMVRARIDHDLPFEGNDRRRRAQRLALPPGARVWAFTLGLAILAILLEIGVVARHPSGAAPLQIPWPLVAAGFCLAELKVVDVHFRREQHSFSLSEFPAVIGLFLLSPTDYLLAVLIGSAVALACSHQTPLKFAFNLVNFGLGATAALAVFHLVATPNP